MTLSFDDLYKMRNNLLNNFNYSNIDKSKPSFAPEQRKPLQRETTAFFKFGQDNPNRLNLNKDKAQEGTNLSALIHKNRADKENEFIILEHTLSVLYIPTKAIRKFLN